MNRFYVQEQKTFTYKTPEILFCTFWDVSVTTREFMLSSNFSSIVVYV